MTTETYHFQYSSDKGWEGDFDKLDREDLEDLPKLEQWDHKTHRFSIVLAATVILVIIIGILFSLNILPRRIYSDVDFKIDTYHSQNDQDRDGVDDQTDILQSARSYLATKPQYASKYYASGYPDDYYGVCTDVIAQALKGAGYDLQELVDVDIRTNPNAYAVDTPDRNIDFRRVKNLAVWFQRHARSLTTNIKDYREWQGGDIVIFKDHIGIISDRRNHDGVPLLIHHYSPIQTTYEEDVLKNYRKEIIGHYRMS